MQAAPYHSICFASGLALATTLLLPGGGWTAPPVHAADAVGQARPGMDRLGDPLPPAALARFGTVRLRHGDEVRAVAFASDGRTLASAGKDETVRLWDVATGKGLRVLRGRANAIAFSPDGKTLAVGADAGEHTLRLWDVTTGREVRRFGPGQDKGHAMAFAPNGKLLASGGEGTPIRLWDPATGTEKASLGKPFERVLSLAFSPDGKTLAAVREFRVCLWDVATGAEVRSFGEESETLQCLAIAPDGRTLATGSLGWTVRLWDLTTGKEIRCLPKVEASVHAVAFSPDGKTLAAACQHQTLHLWDVATGRELRAWSGDAYWVNSVAFAPDGRTLASGGLDHTVRLWDTATGRDLHPRPGHQGRVHSAFLSADGQTANTRGVDGGIRVWRLDSAEELRTLPDGDFSPDRKTLIAPDHKGTVRLLDALTGEERRRFDVGDPQFARVALSPDGRTVAVGGGRKGVVRLRRLEKGEDLHRFVGEEGDDWLEVLSFAPDGKTLLAKRRRSGLRLWEVVTGGEIVHLEARSELASTMPFAADGGRFALRWYHALATPDYTVAVYDAATGKELRRWPWCEARTYVWTEEALTLSPDGSLVTALGGDRDQVVRLLSVDTGRELRRLEGHEEAVRLARFSDDGRTVVTAALDDTIRLWEVATGRERLCLRGHEGRINAFDLTPDGRTLVSVSDDTTALVWDLTGVRAQGARPGRLTAPQGEALWADLGGADAAKAYRSLWRLALAEGGVALLRQRLRPATALDPERVARLLAELDDPSFETRERATRALEELDERVEGALRKARADTSSPEVRRRVASVLEQIEQRLPSGETLRGLRAVEALERAGGAAARQALEALGRGAPEAALTHAAEDALRRLTRAQPPH